MGVLIRSGDLIQFAQVTSDTEGGIVKDYSTALVANIHYEATDQAIDHLLAELYETTISASEFDQRTSKGACAFLEALGLVNINKGMVYPTGRRQ